MHGHGGLSVVAFRWDLMELLQRISPHLGSGLADMNALVVNTLMRTVLVSDGTRGRKMSPIVTDFHFYLNGFI